MNKKVELLAPAGTMEAMIAAISNGADAVYLGGKKFGARASSSNFEDEELIKAVNYAHHRHVKIYVTVNTLIFNDEIKDFMNYVKFLYEIQIDALIVQDLGMLNLIRKNFPDFELHCSTQMNAANSLDVIYLEELGASRVVLARENTGEEISKIKSKSNVELEVFVHGALCMGYSGKCLFSAIEGNRSGNRGECSQPCRMKYSLKVGKNSSSFSYQLSTKDLSTIKSIKDLYKIPFDSYKIEGRMKRPEYVAQVVASYREALDNVDNISDERLAILESNIKHVFNRDYTRGYLLGDRGYKISNTQSPKNIGVLAALVLENSTKKRRLKLELLEDIKVGDGLSTGELVGRILKGKEIVKSAKKGDIIELDFIGKLKQGDKIYKTYSKDIMESAKASIRREFRIFEIEGEITLKIGEYPKLTLNDGVNKVDVLGESLVEEAIKNPISDEKIYMQLSKMGDSAFTLKNLNIIRDERSILPLSSLNLLRRKAVEALILKRTNVYNRNVELLDLEMPKSDYIDDEPISLGVFCTTKEQLDACADEGISRVIVDESFLYDYAHTHFEREQIYFKLPLVTREDEIDEILKDVEKFGDNFIVSSLGVIKHLKGKNTVSHYLLNCTNDYSIGSIPSKYVMPSLELISTGRTDDIIYSEYFDKIEMPIYYRPVLMVTEYCPNKNELGKCINKNCSIVLSTLENERGNEYPLSVDKNCKVLVLGKTLVELDDKVEGFLRAGITRYNIEFQKGLNKESYEKARNIIQKYKKLLS